MRTAIEALAGPSRHLVRRRTPALRIARRFQSTTPTSPSPKIHAAPFLLDPAEAAHKLHMNALIASAKGSNLFLAGLLKLFGPSIGGILREFGWTGDVAMRDMKAVYWPVWRVDALLEGSIGEKGTERSDGQAFFAAQEAYIPGNSFAPLSYLSFAVPPLSEDLPQYDPGEHLSQLGIGYDIVPVPFAVSPFSVIQKMRRAVGSRGRFADMNIDESRWKEVMTACYPIYFPIYVAEFEQKREEGDRRYTIVIDAHDSNVGNCRASWPPPAEIYETGRFTENYYVNPAPFIPDATLVVSLVRPGTAGVPMSNNAVNKAYTSWMSPAPSSVSSIPPSPLVDITDPIDWDDARIQSWTGLEREQNIEYYDKALEVWKVIGALEGLSQMKKMLKDGEEPQGMVVNLKNGGEAPLVQQRPMSEIKKQMEEDVEKMKAELVGLKPTWLVEWEEARKGDGEGEKK